MSEKSAQGLVHHFMRGIRFDGLWEYQVKNASGRLRWRRLPMDEGDVERTDSDGLEWCLRKCIAVAAQQSVQKIEDVEVLLAHVIDMGDWKSICAGYQVLHIKRSDEVTMNSVARLLEEGGYVLLKIESRGKKHQPTNVAATWVWVVGVELQITRQDLSMTDVTSSCVVRALLILWKKNSAPWGGGYGARLSLPKEQECLIRSTDGHWLQGKCIEALFLVPI